MHMLAACNLLVFRHFPYDFVVLIQVVYYSIYIWVFKFGWRWRRARCEWNEAHASYVELGRAGQRPESKQDALDVYCLLPRALLDMPFFSRCMHMHDDAAVYISCWFLLWVALLSKLKGGRRGSAQRMHAVQRQHRHWLWLLLASYRRPIDQRTAY